jgi:hypothetical protein
MHSLKSALEKSTSFNEQCVNLVFFIFVLTKEELSKEEYSNENANPCSFAVSKNNPISLQPLNFTSLKTTLFILAMLRLQLLNTQSIKTDLLKSALLKLQLLKIQSSYSPVMNSDTWKSIFSKL